MSKLHSQMAVKSKFVFISFSSCQINSSSLQQALLVRGSTADVLVGARSWAPLLGAIPCQAPWEEGPGCRRGRGERWERVPAAWSWQHAEHEQLHSSGGHMFGDFTRGLGWFPTLP